MMSEGFLQMLLAQDANWLKRLQYLLVQQARVVTDESADTPEHAARSSYARVVINNPAGAASGASVMVVGGPNLVGTVTLEDAGPVTTASDAAVLSQIATFWNTLAGVGM